jgi:hypothetical protein
MPLVRYRISASQIWWGEPVEIGEAESPLR